MLLESSKYIAFTPILSKLGSQAILGLFLVSISHTRRVMYVESVLLGSAYRTSTAEPDDRYVAYTNCSNKKAFRPSTPCLLSLMFYDASNFSL